jgi:hypothetical protein
MYIYIYILVFQESISIQCIDLVLVMILKTAWQQQGMTDWLTDRQS